MEFDPDKYLAGRTPTEAGSPVASGSDPTLPPSGQPSAGEFNPDQWLAGRTSAAAPVGSPMAPAPVTPTAPPGQAIPAPSEDASGGLGDTIESVWAAMHSAANTATFGASDWGSALLASGLSLLPGLKTMSPAEAHDKLMANLQQESDKHGVAATVGMLGGAVAGGGGLFRLGGKLGMKGITAFQKASLLSNAGKGAAIGAAAGGTEGLLNATSTDDAVTSGLTGAGFGAAGGAILGPLAQAAGGQIAKGVSKANEVGRALFSGRSIREASQDVKAWRFVADKLGVSVDDILLMQQRAQDTRGQALSVAELVGFAKEGKLASMARQNEVLGQAMHDATKAGKSEIVDLTRAALRNAMPRGIVEGTAELTSRRSNRFAQMLAGKGNDHVTLSPNVAEIFQNETVQRALRAGRRDSAMLTRVDQMLAAFEDGAARGVVRPSAALTVNDVNSLRRVLNNIASDESIQRAGIADDFLNWKGMLEDAAGLQHPTYRAAVAAYRQESAYINAYKYGLRGVNPREVTKPMHRADMITDEGRQGYWAGRLTRLYDQASTPEGAASTLRQFTDDVELQRLLSTVMDRNALYDLGLKMGGLNNRSVTLGNLTPGYVNEAAEDVGKELVHGLGAVGAGSPTGGAYHGSRFWEGLLRGHVPKETLKRVSKLITSKNPKAVDRGLEMLRRNGITEDWLRRAAGTGASAQTGSWLGRQTTGTPEY